MRSIFRRRSLTHSLTPSYRINPRIKCRGSYRGSGEMTHTYTTYWHLAHYCSKGPRYNYYFTATFRAFSMAAWPPVLPTVRLGQAKLTPWEENFRYVGSSSRLNFPARTKKKIYYVNAGQGWFAPLKEVLLPYDPLCLSVGWLVGQLVGLVGQLSQLPKRAGSDTSMPLS